MTRVTKDKVWKPSTDGGKKYLRNISLTNTQCLQKWGYVFEFATPDDYLLIKRKKDTVSMGEKEGGSEGPFSRIPNTKETLRK